MVFAWLIGLEIGETIAGGIRVRLYSQSASESILGRYYLRVGHLMKTS